jgi:starch synthase
VASAVGAIPEIVVEGETGYTVRVDDEQGLTSRLLLLLGDPDLAWRMGEAGRARVLSDFTWDAVTARMTRRIAADLAATRSPGGQNDSSHPSSRAPRA